jgi:glycosyltransferase involved in cell wall biosynthesis
LEHFGHKMTQSPGSYDAKGIPIAGSSRGFGKSLWIINQYAGSRLHGMEYRHFYLARALVEKGHDVTVVSGSYSHLFTEPPNASAAWTCEFIDGVRYWWVRVPRYQGNGPRRALNMGVFMLKLFSPRLRQLPRPAGIIVSSPSPLPILPAAVWASRYKAPLVFEVRDVWPLTLVALGWMSRYHPLVAAMRQVERFAYRRADWAVSPLPAAVQHMARLGLAPERFAYIPNGVALADFDDHQPLSGHLQEVLSGGRFIVGHVGTMGPANALDSLLRAALLVRDDPSIVFVLVGSGRDEQQLKATAENLELDNVLFLDRVPRAVVPTVLRACDALFVGYKRNPLYRLGVSPNKLFDYMYSGRPVISSITAANDPVTEAGCGLSVAAEDPEAIAGAVRALRDMPEVERRRLGENGRKYVAQRHSYDELAERYIELLDRSAKPAR